MTLVKMYIWRFLGLLIMNLPSDFKIQNSGFTIVAAAIKNSDNNGENTNLSRFLGHRD